MPITEKYPLCFSITFHRCVQSNIVLLTQAFRRKFVIPDFMSFTSHIDELYESAKKQSGGKVRLGYTYFPNINISYEENKPGYFVYKLRNSAKPLDLVLLNHCKYLTLCYFA